MRDLFPSLDPPPGGADALRRRIAHHERGHVRRRRAIAPGLAVAATGLTVAVAIFVVVGQVTLPGQVPLPEMAPAGQAPATDPGLPEGWAASLVAPSGSGTDAHVAISADWSDRQAVLAVPNRREDIVVYWVEVLDP